MVLTGPLFEVPLAQSAGCSDFELVVFLVENSEQGTFGAERTGGLGDHHIEYLLKIGNGVHRPDHVPEHMKIVFKPRCRIHGILILLLLGSEHNTGITTLHVLAVYK